MEDIEVGNNEDGGGERSDLTEVTHENLGERLKSSCFNISIGLILFFGAFPLLYVNEARSVKRYEALNEAESQVLSISSPWSMNSENEGKLIHFSANITNTNETVEDPVFGIQSSTGALKLHRQAEMYQWVVTDSYVGIGIGRYVPNLEIRIQFGSQDYLRKVSDWRL